MNTQRNESRASKWGWGILLALAALLVLNGVSWFFMASGLSFFEQDTASPWASSRTFTRPSPKELRDKVDKLGYGMSPLAC